MAEAATAKKLILFDLVSTITDAGPRYAEAYRRMAAAYNLPVPSSEEILAELGQRSLKEIIAIHSPELPVERIEDFMAGCNNTCDAILYDLHWLEKLYPDVRETLADLKARGFTLGLFTGTREESALAQLRYHNIEQYFDADLIRAKDNVRDAGKSTEALKAEQIGSILQSWRVRENIAQNADLRRQVIVVGDSLSDLEAAQAHGAGFAGFAGNAKKMQDFMARNVAAIFSRYSNASSMLASILADTLPYRRSSSPELK